MVWGMGGQCTHVVLKVTKREACVIPSFVYLVHSHERAFVFQVNLYFSLSRHFL